ncbi:MAG TPA: RNA polymerase sigma factor [Nocardioides sp.]|nr:RNA polymerase sigma factor [Nocardioides sp.]
MTADPVRAALTAVATERAAILATLIRVTGDWELAEDCVQDAVERALSRWPVEGVPASTAGWLTTVARNRAIDVLRRRATERAKLQEVALMKEPESPPDDLLRLIFTCCHPALPIEARVALTLRTVAGLSTPEIARAFLVSEPTMSQRLLRAKGRIAHAGIPYRVPAPDQLAERTGGVLAVLYLVFNEGYGWREGDLAAEALRLSRLLVELMPTEDEPRGLLALMLFLQGRRATRFDDNGDLVPMEEQDRSRWDGAMVAEGLWHLRRAASSGTAPGPYRLQASIAACHAEAVDAPSTDWALIVRLYDALAEAQPSPVIDLNRAIASGFLNGFEAGLDAMDGLDEALAGYYLLPAARGDFLRRLGRLDEARTAYTAALGLAPGEAERRLLERRLAEL